MTSCILMQLSIHQTCVKKSPFLPKQVPCLKYKICEWLKVVSFFSRCSLWDQVTINVCTLLMGCQTYKILIQLSLTLTLPLQQNVTELCCFSFATYFESRFNWWHLFLFFVLGVRVSLARLMTLFSFFSCLTSIPLGKGS